MKLTDLIKSLRELEANGIGLNECELALSVPLLLNIIEIQRKALEFYAREENYRAEYTSHEWVAKQALAECDELVRE